MPVTADQVKQSMIENNIEKVYCRDCSFCGAKLHYYREDEKLYFDSNCFCVTYYVEPQEYPWSQPADLINMQTNLEFQKDFAKRFGIDL